MKATFEVKSFLSENRELVIEKYNTLTTYEFYNGITLHNFMLQVMQLMVINNPRSEKTAKSTLLFALGEVTFENSKLFGRDIKTEKLTAKYAGTAAMAMV